MTNNKMKKNEKTFFERKGLVYLVFLAGFGAGAAMTYFFDTEAAEKVREWAKDEAGQLVGDAQKWVKDETAALTDSARELAGNAKDLAADAKETISTKAEEVKDGVKELYKDAKTAVAGNSETNKTK